MSDSCKTKTVQEPLKERMKTWAFWKPVVFTVAGGIFGYLYYLYVGCASGTCAITGNPFASTAMGGLFGYFLVSRPCGC